MERGGREKRRREKDRSRERTQTVGSLCLSLTLALGESPFPSLSLPTKQRQNLPDPRRQVPLSTIFPFVNVTRKELGGHLPPHGLGYEISKLIIKFYFWVQLLTKLQEELSKWIKFNYIWSCSAIGQAIDGANCPKRLDLLHLNRSRPNNLQWVSTGSYRLNPGVIARVYSRPGDIRLQ